MNSQLTYGLLACALAVVAIPASAAVVVVDKTADQGIFWGDLDGAGSGNPLIFANSFTLAADATIDTIGAYIASATGNPEAPFRYELWADSGNAPDVNNVLAYTSYRQVSSSTLILDTGLLNSTISLTAGTQYWIIASAVGQASVTPDGSGGYVFGGHTPGTDGGSFGFTSDATGKTFDSLGNTPEMAIYASLSTGDSGGGLSPTPEPSTFVLLALPIAGLAFRRRRAA